jgi:rare lipoprotein A (peptidoglycan hydrolase)
MLTVISKVSKRVNANTALGWSSFLLVAAMMAGCSATSGLLQRSLTNVPASDPTSQTSAAPIRNSIGAKSIREKNRPRARTAILSARAIGAASWYGPGFHGKKTASGDIFNAKKLTAAHRTLPLGSKVRITNLSNRKSVDVEINDRGPFVDGRIIDVTPAAARALGMIDRGTARVKVELLDDITAPEEARNPHLR